MAFNILNGADMSADASYSTGTKPADGAGTVDNLMIPKTNSNTLTNVTALTLVELISLMVESGHSVNIGGAGNALAVNALRFTHRGSGTVYWDGGTGGGEVTTSITVNSPQMAGDGAMQILGGNLSPANIIILNGLVTLGGSLAAVANVLMQAGRFVANDNSNAITRYQQNGGIGDCQMVITTALIFGGSFTQKIGRAVTNLIVGAGARVDYESAETIAVAYCAPGGFLDLSPKDGDRAKTVTVLYDPPGAEVRLSPLVTIGTRVPASADLLAAGLAQFGMIGPGSTL